MLDVDGLDYRIFFLQSNFAAAMKELNGSDVVLVLSGMERGLERRYHNFRETVLRSNARVGAISAGTRPVAEVHSRPLTFRWRLLRALREMRLGRLSLALACRRLWQIVFRRRVQVALDRPALKWAWTGPDESIVDELVLGSETQSRALHTWDFDSELRRPVIRTPRQGVVLVESMGPTHPDFAVLGIPTFVTPDSWFAAVRSWLSSISGDLNESVVVAAHPRAAPGSLDSQYEPFKVLYGASRELLANAKVVVAAEPSTALGWCALYKTPIALAKIADLYPLHWPEMRAYSQELGVPVLEDPADVAIGLKCDGFTPSPSFVDKYLAAQDAPPIPFWETVLNDIQS